MQLYQRELKRLEAAKSFVRVKFPAFGINKKQELTRLLYEISKRESRPIEDIIPRGKISSYDNLKNYLIGIRYPQAVCHGEVKRPYLPKIELRPAEFFAPSGKGFYPKEIYIEDDVSESSLVHRVKAVFPQAHFLRIGSLKEYECAHRGSTVMDYNKRKDKLFIVRQRRDFFKACPCTRNAPGCGYQIFNLGFGCIFECNYCYLQEYTNSSGIILPANLDDFFDKFYPYKDKRVRMGTGEFTDSLALDELTGYSCAIIDFFRKQPKAIFEFKTKSISIENLLKCRHSGNIVVSWSLNPQSLITKNEFYTASLKERITAAQKCARCGFRLGFHFDPIIYYPQWRRDYARMIDGLFRAIRPKAIAWISLGTFRFSPALKKVIERRFPQNLILDSELLPGYDGKLRYPYYLRRGIYKEMSGMLYRHSRKLNVYLCMEPGEIKS